MQHKHIFYLHFSPLHVSPHIFLWHVLSVSPEATVFSACTTATYKGTYFLSKPTWPDEVYTKRDVFGML